MVFESSPQFFTEDINKTEFVVVDFWASWCGPCKMMKQIFEEFSNKLESYKQVKLFSVNTEEFPEISIKYKINAVPTLLYFKNGELYKTEVGLRTESQMVETLNEMKKQ